MLSSRLLMSAILIPSLVLLFVLDHRMGSSALILLGFSTLIAVRNSYELSDLLKTRSMVPSFPAAATLSAFVVLAGWIHTTPIGMQLISGASPVAVALASTGLIGCGIVVSFCLLLVLECRRYESPGRSMESLGSNLIIVLYAGGLMAVTSQLRWFPDADCGYFVITSMIVCVKAGDVFAYTFGRLWGKTKLAPKLSPGKTRMGLIGAIFGSTLGGWLWITFAGSLFASRPQPAAVWIVLTYSASLGLIGLTGDLCESLVKRDVERKDAAALLPGFGGLLDLLDSPLFAGPFVLIWWHVLPPAVFASS